MIYASITTMRGEEVELRAVVNRGCPGTFNEPGEAPFWEDEQASFDDGKTWQSMEDTISPEDLNEAIAALDKALEGE